MVTTLTGANSFALNNEYNKLLTKFTKEHGDIALHIIDCEETEYAKIRESLESVPFLSGKKLVVLRKPSANKDFIENAENLLTELSGATEVIIVEPKLDKRSSFYKLLKKSTEYKEFNELDEPQLVSWIKTVVDISSSDASYLIARVGLNQRLLANELAKLKTYDKKVTKESIELLTEPTPQSSIFQLLEAAFNGNKKQVAMLYDEQRANGVEPQAIIALLAWQLHLLALVKSTDKPDTQIAKDAGINPYSIRKSRSLASKLTMNQIKKHVADLLELDTKQKSTAIDVSSALEAYLLDLG